MLLWLIIAGVAAFAALTAFLYFYQSHFIFFPTRDFAADPKELGLAYEDVYIEVANGERIHGWFIAATATADSAKRHRTVLFCHENAGNISHRFETITYLLDLGADQFVFDYRGYGRSDGSVGEANVYEDALAAYRWLAAREGLEPGQIVIYGRSLGGAVAIDLASKVPCGGLWVESSFTSAEDMGRRMFPFLPVKYLLRYKFDSMGKMSKITCPVVVAHSPDDEMIPYDMGRRLFEVAHEPKRFVRLRGGHNELLHYDDAVYRAELERFLTLDSR